MSSLQVPDLGMQNVIDDVERQRQEALQRAAKEVARQKNAGPLQCPHPDVCTCGKCRPVDAR